MHNDLPPPEAITETLLRMAHMVPFNRQRVIGDEEPCPVCSRPTKIKQGHRICDSAMCRERLLEGCCGE